MRAAKRAPQQDPSSRPSGGVGRLLSPSDRPAPSAAYHPHDFLSEITRTGTAIDRYLTAFETNTRGPVLLQDRLTTLQAKTAQRKALVEQLIQRGLWRPRIRTGFRSSPVRSSAW